MIETAYLVRSSQSEAVDLIGFKWAQSSTTFTYKLMSSVELEEQQIASRFAVVHDQRVIGCIGTEKKNDDRKMATCRVSGVFHF